MATRLYSVVFDCEDIAAQGRWWAEALGWTVAFEADDEVGVVEPGDDDSVPSLTFVPVPEPKSGKNRVHLDLVSSSAEGQASTVDRLLGLGARRLDVGQGDVPWVVLADPEGNELCVLEPRPRYQGTGSLASIVIDAVDPAALARFWVEASGWSMSDQGEDVVTLQGPLGWPDLDFLGTSAPKMGKNRVHLDVAPFSTDQASDDQAADVERLLGLGARRADVGQAPDETFVVLADPEGNEMCVLSAR